MPSLNRTGCAVVFASLLLVSRAHGQVALVLAVEGTVPTGLSGTSVDTIGDSNGDGFLDLVIGEPLALGGRVRVVSGRDGSVLHSAMGTPMFGWSVSATGDLDGDGIGDYVVGAPTAASGHVTTRDGASGALLSEIFPGPGNTAGFGGCVAGVGDFNGDGVGDVAAATSNLGLIYSTATGLPFLLACLGAGPVLGRVGDLTGDGLAEVTNGRPGVFTFYQAFTQTALPMGSVTHTTCHLFFGGPNGQLSLDADFGADVAGVDDVDGDGVRDVIVGASGDDDGGPESGSITIFSGLDASVIHFVIGTVPGAEFGAAVAGFGDLDGDGWPDFAVGAPHDSTAGPDAGAVRLYSGFDASLLGAHFGQPGERLGSALAPLADVNGDGFAEVVAGAPGFDLDRGRVVVLSLCGAWPYGADSDPTQTLTFSWSPGAPPLATLGDVSLAGGGPGNFGFVLVSLFRAAVPFSDVTFLVDATPGHFYISDLFHFGAAGTATFPVDLSQPPLAGFMLDLQGFEVSGAAPGNLFASNGIEVLFCE